MRAAASDETRPDFPVDWPSFLFVFYAIACYNTIEDKLSLECSAVKSVHLYRPEIEGVLHDVQCSQQTEIFIAPGTNNTLLDRARARYDGVGVGYSLILIVTAGEVSVSHHCCRLQARHVSQSSPLLSDKAGPGPGGPDKTEGGGGGSLLCPKCGSPCEHVATFISSTR